MFVLISRSEEEHMVYYDLKKYTRLKLVSVTNSGSNRLITINPNKTNFHKTFQSKISRLVGKLNSSNELQALKH